MLAGGVRGGDEMYAAAAGREQAGLLARKMRQIAECTPELATAVDVQNLRVVTPRTGAILDVISSDLATSWGKTPRWLFIDEICNHDATEGAKGFVDALLTALPKRRDSVCLAGVHPVQPEPLVAGPVGLRARRPAVALLPVRRARAVAGPRRTRIRAPPPPRRPVAAAVPVRMG